MRISFFSTSPKFSGGRMAMFRHANELAHRGHDVTLWIQGENIQIDWLAMEVPVHGFSARSLASLPRADLCIFDRARLAPLLCQAAPGQVVHLCQGFEGTDTELRIRHIWKTRGVLGARQLWKLWRRRRDIDSAYRLPTLKLVTHQHLGVLIAERYRQSSFLVPYGLPPGLFVPPSSPGRSWNTRNVLVVGPTDTGWKRITDALRAAAILKQKMPNTRLIRVAQHPMREVERAIAATDEYHTMLSPRQMAKLYQDADALLISSDASEGFGLPVLEAMASGLPCVVTDIPAFRSFARPTDYARFVDVGDTAGMAAALENLFNDPLERQRLSLRGQEVAAGYSLQHSHDAMEWALQSICSQKAPGKLAA